MLSAGSRRLALLPAKHHAPCIYLVCHLFQPLQADDALHLRMWHVTAKASRSAQRFHYEPLHDSNGLHTGHVLTRTYMRLTAKLYHDDAVHAHAPGRAPAAVLCSRLQRR